MTTPCSSRTGSILAIRKFPLCSSGSASCRAVCRSLCRASRVGGARMRASTRYVSRLPSWEISWTCPGATGAPLAGLSLNQVRGVSNTKTRIRMTARSYGQVPRSYDQKNVLERICPRLAILIRRHPIHYDAVAHVYDTVEIGGGFGVVGDH